MFRCSINQGIYFQHLFQTIFWHQAIFCHFYEALEYRYYGQHPYPYKLRAGRLKILRDFKSVGIHLTE